MSSTTVVTITSEKNAQTIKDLINKDDRRVAANNLAAMIQAMAGGTHTGKIELAMGAVAASGTLTFDTVIATDVITINGVTFACVASGADETEFNKGSDDTESAANAAATVNASENAAIAGIVTASSAGAVLTITAVEEGDGGTAITISSVDSTITASAARLATGSDGTTATWNFGLA